MTGPEFEWDTHKATLNLAKHGVAFEDAALIFADHLALMEPNQIVDGEPRWQAIGMAGRSLLLVVIHVVRPRDDRDNVEVIRIISARKAESKERRRYEQGNGATHD